SKALAIPWYDQAISHLEDILGQGEKNAEARRSLRNAYWGRAEGRTELGLYAEAVADWDRALKLDDGSHKKEWAAARVQAKLKIIHLAAKEGKHQKADAAVEEWLKEAPSPQVKMSLAHVLAVCSAIAEEEKMSALVDAYAARAVALVRQAYMEGYFRDNPNVTVLASFRAIGPIARLADFQKLVKE